MAANSEPARRLSAATIALAAAGLLAVGAIGIAVFRSGDRVAEAPDANAAAGQAPSADEMIARMGEELRRNPDNHEGWHLLGLVFRDERRFAEAEQAFRRAMELAPRNADYTAYLAEMLLLRNQANPPAEVERLFRRTLELEPGNASARFYLATMRDQRGEHRAAIDELIALLREAPADAPWRQQVRDATIAIARQNDIDIEGRLPPAPQPSASTAATAAIPGPTREQMEAASAIPPSQQDQMVQGMVDRLATRLRQNPRDAQGWMMLMRSRMVLNDPPGATAALRSGLAAFANDAAVQNQLRDAARQLGVPNP